MFNRQHALDLSSLKACPTAVARPADQRNSKYSTDMGKCYSRNANITKEDDTTKDDEVKNNSTEAKGKTEQTVNGQVENAGEANANEAAGNKKDSSLKDKKAKANKESKTVRITETTTSDVKTETKETKEKAEQKSDDTPKPTQVIKAFLTSRSCCLYNNNVESFPFLCMLFFLPVPIYSVSVTRIVTQTRCN